MTNEELAVAIQQGDMKALGLLWKNTERFFKMKCNEYLKRCGERLDRCGVTFDDMMQEAFFVLLDAVKAYDSAAGFKLTAYFTFPMKNRFNILLGRHQSRRREPLNDSSSIDAPLDEAGDLLLADAIPDPYSARAFHEIEHADYIAGLHADLDAAMRKMLNEQERNIVCDYHYAGLTKAAIGEKNDLTPEQVSRTLQRCYDKLANEATLRRWYARELWRRLPCKRAAHIAYRGVGLQSFKETGMSHVERSLELMERIASKRTTP